MYCPVYLLFLSDCLCPLFCCQSLEQCLACGGCTVDNLYQKNTMTLKLVVWFYTPLSSINILQVSELRTFYLEVLSGSLLITCPKPAFLMEGHWSWVEQIEGQWSWVEDRNRLTHYLIYGLPDTCFQHDHLQTLWPLGEMLVSIAASQVSFCFLVCFTRNRTFFAVFLFQGTNASALKKTLVQSSFQSMNTTSDWSM